MGTISKPPAHVKPASGAARVRSTLSAGGARTPRLGSERIRTGVDKAYGSPSLRVGVAAADPVALARDAKVLHRILVVFYELVS